MEINTIIVGLILAFFCACFVTEFLRAFYHKKFKKALILKGLASSCFIAFGAYNFFSRDFSFPTLVMLLGLCLGIIGDEIIALCQIYPNHDKQHFLGGGAFFIFGHILYMIALFMLSEVNVLAIVISFLLMVLLCVIYEKRKNFFVGELKNSLKLYIGVVIFVTALGIGDFIQQKTVGLALFAIGGALFTISDNILFAFKFGNRPRYRQNVILHIAYYLAQFVIAWSIACV